MNHPAAQYLRALISSVALLISAFIPIKSFAGAHFMFLNACWGGVACDTVETVGIRFNKAFIASAGLIALSIFLIGAFLMVFGGVSETLRQSGKRAMINSLVGLAIVVGCYGIYRTVVFLLYS